MISPTNVAVAGLATLAACAVAVLAYNGTFGTTGAQWYAGCWEKSVEYRKDWMSGKEPISPDAYKALIWANCDLESQRGVYAAGMVFHQSLFVPDPSTYPEAYSMATACPAEARDVPVAGLYLLTVKLVQENGGPSFLDRFRPAKFMLADAMTRRWPGCSKERKRQGYPRIVEKAPGKFDFEKPCLPCERVKKEAAERVNHAQ